MNTNKTRVPVGFGPETRFELRPASTLRSGPATEDGPAAPFRVTRETEFERLKTRLLAEQLDGAPPALNAPLRRAANEAAALAWVTFYPLLVFPVLFEEKTLAAARHAQRQARIYAASHELLAV